MKEPKITSEILISNGWIKSDGEPNAFEKKIENRNPINSTPEDTDIKLVIHGLYNTWTFAVEFPDGGLLNFVANSIEELNAFENAIDFYDCSY